MTNGRDHKQDANALIEQNLKRLYDEALKEEVPERFTDLLKKLRDADEKNGRPS